MPGMMESIGTINSVVRTVLAVILVGAVGAGGWYTFDSYYSEKRAARAQAKALEDAQSSLEQTESRLASAQQQLHQKQQQLQAKDDQIAAQTEKISLLNEDVKQLEQDVLKLSTSLRLLKVTHRIARFTVLDQQPDPDTGRLVSTIEFVELNEEGHPITEPRTFEISGDVIYFDNWVVKFDDKYVEQADVDRSTSLVLFRRIFGEFQEPNDGYPIDKIGARPEVYARGGKPSELEQKIWDDFWNIANDRQRAEELGIRAAHGEAVSIRVRQGKSYRLVLRASDGLSVVPEEDTPPAPSRPAT